MKNTLLILLFLFSFSSCTQTTREKTNQASLLWKISGNGLEQPSYLFGTAHGFSDRFLERVPLFYEAFDSVQQLIVEVYPINIQEMKNLSRKYASEKFLPEGIKYSDLLDKDDILYLDSVLMKYWHTTSDKVVIKPNALYNELKNDYIRDEKTLENFSMDTIFDNSPLRYITSFNEGSLPMESYMVEQAETRGYTIIGLETLEYQMMLKFTPDIPLEVEAKSLIMKLRNREQIINALGDGVVSAYFSQDVNMMLKSYDEASRLSGLGESYVLSPVDEIKKRNQDWIPIIKSAIVQKASMIAVGAGHLPGGYGLIEQLRQEGYTVDQFK